jgi:hypothetical protein
MVIRCAAINTHRIDPAVIINDVQAKKVHLADGTCPLIQETRLLSACSVNNTLGGLGMGGPAYNKCDWRNGLSVMKLPVPVCPIGTGGHRG